MGHLLLPCSCFDAPVKPYDEVTSFIVGNYFDGNTVRSACESPRGGAPPARNSTSVASRKGSQDVDHMHEFNCLVTRAHDELDMLVASAQSKRQD